MDEWNSLPLEVHLACSVDKFKASVIKFVCNCNYYYSDFFIFYEVICFYMGSRTLLQIILMAFFFYFVNLLICHYIVINKK